MYSAAIRSRMSTPADSHSRSQARRGLARVRVLPWQDETDHVVRVCRPQLIENAAVNYVVRW